MKKSLLFLATLTCYFIPETIFAQSPNWLWAKSPGGSSSEIGSCVVSDASGNVYVAGEFHGPSIIFGYDTLTNTGPGGIFIVKYDSSGNVIWAAGANGNGGFSGGQVYCITMDGNGNLIIGGAFYCDTLTFDSIVLLNNGSSDIFIAEYDPSGNLISAVRNGGNDNERVEGITSDENGNIYLTGSFESPSVTFGSTTLTNSNAGYFDLFIVKYDNSWNVVWAKKAGGTNHDDGISICVDTSGSVYLTGMFRSPTITFGTTTFTNSTAWNYGFVVKYNSSGNVIWAKRAGDVGSSITTDEVGYIYVTGEFSGTFLFDTIPLSSPLGNEEMFVAKYDLSGNVIWARGSFGTTTGYNRGFSIAMDPDGNVFVAGIFTSNSITFGNTVLTHSNTSGDNDIFVTKYDNSGNLFWARSVGGDAEDVCYGITTDAIGNVYLTGYFQSTTISFDSVSLAIGGGLDMFIAKLGSSSVTASPSLIQSSKQILVYPNPFSQSTTVSFSLSEPQKISLKIFDMNGRLISTIADASFEEGEHEIIWNASAIISGIYFLQMQTSINLQTEKLIVTK